MDYTEILKKIKPTTEEREALTEITIKIQNYINSFCSEQDIPAEAILVGSQAKGTYLRGKSDIDIFIAFPLNTSQDELKRLGLKIAYETNGYFNGEAAEHYASHPYLTCMIQGCEVDLVPCYKIEEGDNIVSAVDRTILHTNYILKHVKEEQKDDILLLKRFMDCVGVYGSEFKVGGFAGYLCELLILEYGTFEKCLENVCKWKFNFKMDLENYGTSSLFKEDPLVVIDPTDKNRNVAAALRLDKMCEFIDASRNYLNSSNKEQYFETIISEVEIDEILEDIQIRGSDFIAIEFTIPEIPLDTLHPQLKKTSESLATKLDANEFNVFKSGYWTDEESKGVFLFEMASSKLNNIKINKGPKIYVSQACERFSSKHGIENCYILDDFMAVNVEREFTTASSYIEHVFTKENISLIKVGKNLKSAILNSYAFIDVGELDSEFLYEFLNPSFKTKR